MKKLGRAALYLILGFGKSIYSWIKGLTLLFFFILAAVVLISYMAIKGLILNFVGGFDKVNNYFKNINFNV